MRRLIPLFAAPLALAACTADMAQPVQRTGRQEDTLRRALAGKVPQRPVARLPTYNRADMEVVDDATILFHDGSNRVYVQSPSGGCAPLGSGHYTLVTQLHGSNSLCRGDISRIVDLAGGGMTVGSCAMNDFVPFEKPRG